MIYEQMFVLTSVSLETLRNLSEASVNFLWSRIYSPIPKPKDCRVLRPNSVSARRSQIRSTVILFSANKHAQQSAEVNWWLIRYYPRNYFANHKLECLFCICHFINEKKKLPSCLMRSKNTIFIKYYINEKLTKNHTDVKPWWATWVFYFSLE